MSLNGSGVASIDSAGQPAVDSTLITAAAHNALTADIATMISTCVMKDGQQTITANIPFNNKKITDLAAATARTDAASIATIQDGTGIYIATVGGTGNATTLTPSPAVTAYTAGHRIAFIAAAANTGSVTLNVSGLGAKNLLKDGGSILATGDILVGSLVEAVYQGASYMLANGAAGSVRPDSAFRIAGSSDATKMLAFEVDGLTTGTTRTVTVPDRSLTLGVTLAAEVSVSGTTVDFTSIPVGTRRITVMLVDVSRSGTSNILVQLGDAGGIETSGYVNVSSVLTNAAAVVTASSTAGWVIASAASSAAVITGSLTLNLEESTGVRWTGMGTFARTDSAAILNTTGLKSVSAILDRVRVTMANGTDTFTAGVINISYE